MEAAEAAPTQLCGREASAASKVDSEVAAHAAVLVGIVSGEERLELLRDVVSEIDH